MTLPPPVRINAHSPLWRIVDALAASGWGELRDAPQSVRTYLLALGRLADARTGLAEITDAQAAERAGLSVRTIIRARTWLQEAGLLEQLRRGARQGLRGVASLLRLGKRALVAMLPGARAAKDARARARAARPGGAPNLTPRPPFPSLRRKAGAPRWGVRTAPSTVQKQLVDEAAHAAANPVRPETLASIRAMLARRS
ncbi:helix-turn-helix domain-containing protein [Puerhibacterium puerhi]|uniref:hypothetical protein n=1 Tax=Puerhibacterium puerhi TaxID=2692623 RepID=UPI00135A3132|nr:hypothetical protein [Puerhibacterium puerhi]